MLTFGQLKTGERSVLWPSPTEPRNLREAHDRFFAEAMSELSQWVTCLQENNTQVFPACGAYVHCAKSVFPAPVGLIKRVYTVANDGYCNPVFYRSRSFAEVEAWARESMVNWTSPVNATLPALQEGFAYPDTTNDGKCGRAQIGIWAIYRSKIYVAPWLESNESLICEWDGVKKSWGDDDILDDELWGIPEKEAIRAFVAWKHAFFYGCDVPRAKAFEKEFTDQLAMLIYECEKRTEQQHEENIPDVQRFRTQAEATAEAVPDPEDATIVFAAFGDFGEPTESGGAGVLGVSELVKSWDPAFIVTLGDNIYSPTDNYDDAVGAYYGDYITDDLNTNRFWPCIGNHDRTDPANGLADYYAYFTLPGNERYYELVRGPVHFFMLHSALTTLGATPTEPDGLTSTSAQAQWLRARMALSPAKWKIVVVHDSPYTLGEDFPGHTILRWPYRLWGADAVLSGDDHRYERYEVDSLPYLVAGLGGATRDNPHATGELAPYLKASYNANWGALKCTAGCDTLKFEFITMAGVLIDTLELTKD